MAAAQKVAALGSASDSSPTVQRTRPARHTYAGSRDVTIQRMDHVGNVVDDLPAAIELFVELGLEPQARGRWKAAGWTASWGSRALRHGRTDNVPPCLRPEYSGRYFAAFVIDPDHNNVEAVFHKPSTEAGSVESPAKAVGTTGEEP